MKFTTTDRGFGLVTHETYLDGRPGRVVQESSMAIDLDSRPGASALWIGADHHLGEIDVKELIEYLQRWLETGSLAP